MDYTENYTIIENGRYKKLTNGTCYSCKTPDNIINHCEFIRENKIRCLFRFGNPETGEDWGEIYNIHGRIGRSVGKIKIPLLIYNKRSRSGIALIPDSIIAIFDSTHRQAIYVNPRYHIPREIITPLLISIIKPYEAQIKQYSKDFTLPEKI